MKHKQRIKIALLLVVVGIAIIGIIGGNRKNEPTEKEKQIAFLKKHEEEMTEYIKYKSEYVILKKYDIKEIEYNWNSVKKVQSMAFSPETLAIEVAIFGNNNKNLDEFEIYILPDNMENPSKIKNIE